MKALVTGATGFIGSHLTEALLSEGAEVRALARSPLRLRWLKDVAGIDVQYGTLEDEASLKQALRGVDVVFHTAGVVKAREARTYFQVNAQGTARLLDAVGQAGSGIKRFVHVSSQAAAGPGPDFEPLDEDAPPRPITPYGRSKLEAEKCVLEWKDRIPVTVVRPPAVYGPRDVDIFIYFKLAGRGIVPIPGFGRRMVSIVYVKDLVRGILLAAANRDAVGKTFYITSGDHDWTEIAKTLKQAMGRGKAIRLPVTMLKLAALISETFSCLGQSAAAFNRHKALELTQRAWLCSSERARRVLGYRPEWPLDQGMRVTAAWYRNAGWLQG
jgi:dihydroflavonol-4-reductase